MQFAIDEQVGKSYPGAAFGVLEMAGVRNPPDDERLEARKREVEGELRERFGGLSRAELKALPPFDAYCTYYKHFNRSYHVLLQMESILKGKSIPAVAALVEAMFLAELRFQLLTAGHDLALLEPPLRVTAAEGSEEFIGLGGAERRAVRGDLLLRDKEGAVSSILGGPDHRTRIRENTSDALFFVYAPPVIETALIHRHLEEIEELVLLFAPEARLVSLAVVSAP